MRELMNITGGGEPLTMTSLEIAELVDSNHADVRRSIERLADRGVISLPPLAEVKVQRERRAETVSVYRVGKRDSYVIVAQLSPEFTARLVDRWQALEEQARNPIVNLSRVDLLKMALDSEEKRLALEHTVEKLAPKAEALDRIATCTDGSLRLRDACATLQVPEKKFLQRLDQMNWIYRGSDGDWHAYAEPRKQLYLEHKLRPYIDAKDGDTKYSTQVRVTARGMAKLAEIFEREGAPA